MRYGGTVRAEIPEIPDRMRSRMVPRLFLQPILENCIEYGLGASSGNAVIRVAFAENSLVVENSGDGFSQQRLLQLCHQLETTDDDSRTSGLTNVHRRLKLRYGELGGVELCQSSLGGLKVQKYGIPVRVFRIFLFPNHRFGYIIDALSAAHIIEVGIPPLYIITL